MDITHLVYLGPASHKTVTGLEFPRDVPVAVNPRQAKSILRYWPASFAGLLPCPNCSQASPEHQEAASPVEAEQPEPDLPEEAPEAVQAPKKNKGGRPRKE